MNVPVRVDDSDFLYSVIMEHRKTSIIYYHSLLQHDALIFNKCVMIFAVSHNEMFYFSSESDNIPECQRSWHPEDGSC